VTHALHRLLALVKVLQQPQNQHPKTTMPFQPFTTHACLAAGRNSNLSAASSSSLLPGLHHTAANSAAQNRIE
jgi:hypothetical protein